MNKYLIYTLLFFKLLIQTSCTHYDKLDQDFDAAFYGVINKTIKKSHLRLGTSILGFGGEALHEINSIEIDFFKPGYYTLEEARSFILQLFFLYDETFQSMYEELKPFLAKKFTTIDRSSLRLIFYDDVSGLSKAPFISAVSFFGKRITYTQEKANFDPSPGLAPNPFNVIVLEETIEEAKRKLIDHEKIK